MRVFAQFDKKKALQLQGLSHLSSLAAWRSRTSRNKTLAV